MKKTLSMETALVAGRDFVKYVEGMTGGKGRLTGEFSDFYLLDYLLAPHYSSGKPSPELADFALSTGVYTALMIFRFWADTGLQPRWHEASLDQVGIGLSLSLDGEKESVLLLTPPSDVYGLVTELPNPFPVFEGSWQTLRPGDPVLPRYVLGALFLSQPLFKTDTPTPPPVTTPFLEGHVRTMNRVVALSCAQAIEPEEGLQQRLLTELFALCIWPPIGTYGNDYGVENLRLIAKEADFAGEEHHDDLLEALSKMEKSWVSDAAYLAAIAFRAMKGRDDLPEEHMGFNVHEVRDVLAEAVEIFKVDS